MNWLWIQDLHRLRADIKDGNALEYLEYTPDSRSLRWLLPLIRYCLIFSLFRFSTTSISFTLWSRFLLLYSTWLIESACIFGIIGSET
jgi:hypothetical protein